MPLFNKLIFISDIAAFSINIYKVATYSIINKLIYKYIHKIYKFWLEKLTENCYILNKYFDLKYIYKYSEIYRIWMGQMQTQILYGSIITLYY